MKSKYLSFPQYVEHAKLMYIILSIIMVHDLIEAHSCDVQSIM